MLHLYVFSQVLGYVDMLCWFHNISCSPKMGVPLFIIHSDNFPLSTIQLMGYTHENGEAPHFFFTRFSQVSSWLQPALPFSGRAGVPRGRAGVGTGDLILMIEILSMSWGFQLVMGVPLNLIH